MDLPTTHYDDSVKVEDTNTPTDSNDSTESKSTNKNRLQKASLYILLATIFLAPLIFVPSIYFPSDIIKVGLLSIGILLSCIFCLISSILNRNFTFHRNTIIYSIILLAISITLPTFSSTSFIRSFIGQGFEITTASFLFLMFSAFFLVTYLMKNDKDAIFSIYIAVLASSMILVLFHITRLLGGVDFMKFGILTSPTSTLIGKWYDFAIFTGILGLISLFGIKFLSLAKLSKIILYVSLAISGFLLLAIDFKLLWAIIAITVLGIIIYEFYTKVPEGSGIKRIFSRVSIFSLIILIIAIFGAWKANSYTANLSKALNIQHAEVVLPWQLTLDVASDTIKESPLLGAGPNRFNYQFLKFKPYQDINPTPYWGTEFILGFGMIPTFIVNQGLIGVLLWCLFLIFFIREGIRSLKKQYQDLTKKFFIISSFFIALFLWLMNLVYIPSHTIFFMTFVFTGIFVATLFIGENNNTEQDIPNRFTKLKKYLPYLYMIITVIFVLWLGLYTKKLMAISYFQSGIKELNVSGNADNAEVKFNKALSFDKIDVYYQALSETNILKLNNTIKDLQNSGTLASPSQESLNKIAKIIEDAMKYTEKAQIIDPTNYYNFLEEARVSEMASTLKIENAYENAKNSYANAIFLNKYSPSLYLGLARLLATNSDFAGAQQYIGRALQLKQNYTEAVFLLSQVQVSNGQIKDAIISARFATQINPNDQTLFMQLGLLEFNDKNYEEAIKALERAVAIDSQYANARYFLGLSYNKVGRDDLALAQFEELAKTNPDSQEVAFILNNLRSGKSPFANVEPPIDNKPEKRKTLPVDESSKSKSETVVEEGSIE